MPNNNDDHIDSDPGARLPRAIEAQQAPLVAALPVLKIRLAATPNDPALLLTLARACSQAGRWDEGLDYAQRAYRLRPGPGALDMIMDNLYRLGDRDEFERHVQLAISAGGLHARNMVSLHVLKDRQFTRGFALRNELRASGYGSGDHPVSDNPGIPWWDGDRFPGTLLVIAEQALGEELLNSGVFGDLVRLGQQATIECDPRLMPLFRRSFPRLQFVERFSGQLAAACHPGCRKTSASDLRHILHKDDRFTHPHHWLQANPAWRDELRAGYGRQAPGQYRVGISWRSFRATWGSVYKTLQLTHLVRTLNVADTAWFSLQYGPVNDDLAAARAAPVPVPVPRVDHRIDPVANIDALAAQVAAMDVVVTTSNTTAHLAGALGVPTLLMLPTPRGVFPYWGYSGDHTPWYPSMTIVRGNGSGDLAAFDARVAATLTDMLQSLQERDHTP